MALGMNRTCKAVPNPRELALYYLYRLFWEGGCNAVKSRDLEIWGRFQSPPLPKVPSSLLALTTNGGLVLAPQFDNIWSHCSP